MQAGGATPSLSSDGRYVSFESRASNLEPGGGSGIFVHDRQTGVTTAAVVVPAGTTGHSLNPMISGNARF